MATSTIIGSTAVFGQLRRPAFVAAVAAEPLTVRRLRVAFSAEAQRVGRKTRELRVIARMSGVRVQGLLGVLRAGKCGAPPNTALQPTSPASLSPRLSSKTLDGP